MSLLELIGFDADELEWQDLGLCNGMDREDFYDNYETNEERAKAIDEVCLSCPVMAQCARWGQENNEQGVWGGIYWDGTGKPDPARNAHKSKETWKRIRERIESV